MNYKKEISLLKKNRGAYFPVMDRMMDLYRAGEASERPVEIILPEMLTVLELLDIEYLDPESFIIKQSFGDIRAVYYNGGFPVTTRGMEVHNQWMDIRRAKFRKIIAMAIAAVLIAGVMLYFLV